MISFHCHPAGWPLRMSKSLGAKGCGMSLKLVSTPGYGRLLPPMHGKAEAMDYDDDESVTPRGLASGDPPPPDDWIGYQAAPRATALYAAHRPELAGFLKNRAPAQEVGDLLQECFRRLFSSPSYPRVLLEQPRAYLFRTARNLVAERHRSRNRALTDDHHSFEDPEIAGPDPHAAIEARDQLRRVEECLARLPHKTRTIFILHRFDGLGYDEIAAEMGMKVKGVEKQIAKAMLAIRRARANRP